MPRKLKIDRAVYLVDDTHRSYTYLSRNPEWRRLSPRQNLAHKRQIEGYTRVFRDGRKKTYRSGRRPSPRASKSPPRLYTDLAPWFHLLTSPDDYAEEASFYAQTLRGAADIPVVTVLELGSGGGNNASHMKSHFRLTLVDRSAAMLAISRGLNPECEHLPGDMRTARLGRTFDAVFIHDAIDYLTTPEDLHKAATTAFVHCRAGGSVLLAPDAVRETFRPSTSHGGCDGVGRSLRYLEWTWDPDPADTRYVSEFAYLMQEDGRPMRLEADHHELGLFSRSDWLSVLASAGFRAWSLPFTHSEIPEGPLEVFVGIRPRQAGERRP